MHLTYFPAFLLIALVLGSNYSTVYSQSRVNSSGTGGKHTIQGRIFLPNGRSPEVPISIELQSTNFSTVTVTTDQSGGFSFRALAPGNYTVVVAAGSAYETATEHVTIDTEVMSLGRQSTAKTITLPIYLQYKRVGNAKNGVINAELAGAPKEALKFYEKGIELSRAGRSEESITEYQKAVSIYPQFTSAYIEIGKNYLKLGKFESSVTYFRSALKFAPQEFEAKLGYGIALFNIKNLKEAEKELSGAIEINKNSAVAHYYLGLIFIQDKKVEEARKELELAKQLKATNSLPLIHKFLGGVYWAEKKYKLAADELEMYLKLSPSEKDAEKIRQTIAELRAK